MRECKKKLQTSNETREMEGGERRVEEVRSRLQKPKKKKNSLSARSHYSLRERDNPNFAFQAQGLSLSVSLFSHLHARARALFSESQQIALCEQRSFRGKRSKKRAIIAAAFFPSFR